MEKNICDVYMCITKRERKSKSKTLSELEIVIEVEERIGYSDRGK